VANVGHNSTESIHRGIGLFEVEFRYSQMAEGNCKQDKRFASGSLHGGAYSSDGVYELVGIPGQQLGRRPGNNICKRYLQIGMTKNRPDIDMANMVISSFGKAQKTVDYVDWELGYG